MSDGHLVLAVDIPSGLNADFPKPIGYAVRADVTVTFTAPKIANVLAGASGLTASWLLEVLALPKR